MPAAPRPSFEHDRLQALMSLKILDTPPSEYLDSLVHTASKMMDMPIAAITLVAENRQWFKSSIGWPSVTETPREEAFCAYTVLDPMKPFLVSNAVTDPRVFDLPIVTGCPYIRSYAGVPLLDKNNLPVGALCVIDSKPRQFGAADVSKMMNLARVISNCIRLHGAVQHLKRH